MKQKTVLGFVISVLQMMRLQVNLIVFNKLSKSLIAAQILELEDEIELDDDGVL